MAAAFCKTIRVCWLHALAMRPAGGTAKLHVTRGPPPAGVACACPVSAGAMRPASGCAEAPLAPRPTPPETAVARSGHRVASAVPIASVHAFAFVHSALAAHQESAVVALTAPTDAPTAAVARKLASWTGGAGAVLAIGAAPPGLTDAEATRVITASVPTATA